MAGATSADDVSVRSCRTTEDSTRSLPCVVFPFLRGGFRLDIEDDDAGALEDSSEGRDDGL